MGSSAADRARLEEIEVEVLNLRRSIDILHAEEEQVKKRLNSCHYPVLTLPNELVSEIFLHFIPAYPRCFPLYGCFSPLLLTHICRQWRDIALSMPPLWRAISFNHSDDDPDFHLEVVKNWLGRSGQYPLSIETEELGDGDDEFFQAILPYRTRWEYIAVHFGEGRAPPPRIDGPMPLLRQLEIRISSYDTAYASFLSFRDAPMLTTATLWDFIYPPDLLPWARLTSLTLIATIPSRCTTVLERTVNLVHCELSISDDNVQHFDTTLLCLESLVLIPFAVENSDAAGDYLLSFIVPALRRLQIPEQHDPLETLASFIIKSGCKLQELCITGERLITTSGYRNMFPSIPRIAFCPRLTHWCCWEAYGIRQNNVRGLSGFLACFEFE